VFSLVAKELYLTNQKDDSESEYSEYTEGQSSYQSSAKGTSKAPSEKSK
jgi:hypothetical protein